jgi:hypothetical protein
MRSRSTERRARTGLVIGTLLLAAGCASSLDPYAERPLRATEAIVLVGVDSSIPLSEARTCDAFCTAWYTLGGRREIMAYPVRVGTKFKLNSIYTMDNRVAPLNGEEMVVAQRGVYYYGTIVSSSARVGVVNKPAPKLLAAAKRKYGTRFDALAPQNFTWPDPAADDLGLTYQDSAAVQAALAPRKGARVHVAQIVAAKKFDRSCRGGSTLSLPDFLPYEEYLRRALNHELASAGLQAEGADALALKGTLTDLAFSTFGEKKFWKIGLRLDAPDGRSAKALVTKPFATEWAAALACPTAEDEWPGAVQYLFEALVATPEFAALLSPSVASASQH